VRGSNEITEPWAIKEREHRPYDWFGKLVSSGAFTGTNRLNSYREEGKQYWMTCCRQTHGYEGYNKQQMTGTLSQRWGKNIYGGAEQFSSAVNRGSYDSHLGASAGGHHGEQPLNGKG